MRPTSRSRLTWRIAIFGLALGAAVVGVGIGDADARAELRDDDERSDANDVGSVTSRGDFPFRRRGCHGPTSVGELVTLLLLAAGWVTFVVIKQLRAPGQSWTSKSRDDDRR